ncbi:MAG: triose-phosphate isomerase [Candidatus Paceibacterota bacterium]
MEKKKDHYIIGNWKMNPDNKKEAKKLFTAVRKASQRRHSSIIICPSFVYLPLLSSERTPKSLSIGAQDCFFKDKGSFTGEVSPVQLTDMKAEYVILGHSERRELGEDDEMVSKKIKAALASGLKPIVCIGEKQRDKEGEYLQFLESQLSSVFSGVSAADLDQVLVAYEPIWAIGQTEEEAITGHLLHETVVFIKRFLVRRYGKEIGFATPVIYGGAVTNRNVEDLLQEGKADGVLIGRQSLDPKSFTEIIDLVDNL